MKKVRSAGVRRRTLRRSTPAMLSFLLVVTAGACSSTEPKANDKAASSELKTLSAATLNPGQPVPAPAGEPVLRVSGRIGTTNTEGALALDLATVERLGLVSFKLYEPFQKRRMGFQGVPFGRVLELSAPQPGTQDVHMVALDDYTADLKLAAARNEGVMLATRSGDGSLLPVDDGGPIRIVFLDGTPGGDKDESWIWSLATLEVR
jgi:hypothetical protein